MTPSILGIDPGSRHTGYGIVVPHGAGFRHIEHGVIAVPADRPLGERLLVVFEELGAVIARTRPAAAACERVFLGKNAQSALMLGQARAAAVLAAAVAQVPLFEYAPAAVKQAVIGRGRAEKSQMQMMIKVLLGLPELPPPDAADALAVALCHCQHQVELRIRP